MECPRDHSVLKSGVYEGNVDVDVCPACQGMWLDMGELERIEDTREHDYSEELKRMPNVVGAAYEMARQKNVALISCPKCGAEMSRHEYAFCSQIIIDVCPKSEGIWLDKGEIERLEVFFERSRMEAGQIRNGFWKSLVAFFGK